MGNVSSSYVCPWWLGYVLVSPIRRLLENPDKILGPFVREGMTILEIGSGMGYYSLPLARMVGRSGRVVCVDIQEKMLRVLRKRATKANFMERITPVLASPSSFGLEFYQGRIDFAFLFAVVHEIPDKDRLFEEVYRTMKPDGMLLISEPNGHVKQGDFQKCVELATLKGFAVAKSVDIWRYTSVSMKIKS